MKDLREQIREMADKYAGKVLGKNDDDFPNFHSGDIEMAYKNGANFILSKWQESERWRKVEEELPDSNIEFVLTKTKNGSYDVCYYWREKGDFVCWDCPVQDVIEWKPIK